MFKKKKKIFKIKISYFFLKKKTIKFNDYFFLAKKGDPYYKKNLYKYNIFCFKYCIFKSYFSQVQYYFGFNILDNKNYFKIHSYDRKLKNHQNLIFYI